MSRLKKLYEEKIVPDMKSKFGISNIFDVPRLNKIVINCGIGEAVGDAKALDGVMEDLALITGQKPVPTIAKEAISNFRIRKGMKIGCKVTLRDKRMYEFLDRLVSISLPRVRDFRGTSRKAFDRMGNYTLGLREHSIFPEVDPDKAQSSFGMDITFVIKNKKGKNPGEQNLELLSMLGMPFAKN